jgi:hypothetical protein
MKNKAFPASKFTWLGRTGYCDASDLGLGARVQMPTTLVIKSTRTGVTKCFDFDSWIDTPNESEIASWVYKSVDGFFLNISND